MRAVRDDPAAQWLPSRRHFALARLAAVIRSRFPTAPRTDVDRILFAIDRDQTTSEQYAISIWVFVSATCYAAALLPLHWIAISPVAAVIGIQGILFLVGNLGPLGENHLRRNSIAVFGTLIAISVYLALQRSPVRYVAWFFLSVVVANAVASLIMLALRNRVREMEQRCGI